MFVKVRRNNVTENRKTREQIKRERQQKNKNPENRKLLQENGLSALF